MPNGLTEFPEQEQEMNKGLSKEAKDRKIIKEVDYEEDESFYIYDSDTLDWDREKRDELAKVVFNEVETTNTNSLTNNIEEWDDLYNGILPIKTFPWKFCYSEDTEVLTKEGWKFFKDLKNDLVYSVNPDTGIAEYMPIQEFTEMEVTELIEFKSKSIDLAVTPEHNMYVQNRYTGEKKFIQAKDLLKINGAHLGIPLVSNWVGKNAKTINGFDAEDWMQFLGWYISEGYIFKSGNIGICQDKKTNSGKCRDIENLLTNMGLKYSYSGNIYIISKKHITDAILSELKELGKCSDKYIPQKYMNYNIDLLRCLLGSLIKGDGTYAERGNRIYNPLMSYYTTSKRLSGNIQELVQKIGLRATISKMDHEKLKCLIRGKEYKNNKDIYTIRILFKSRAKIQSLSRKTIKYEGSVYCVTTPYHTLYVRRNGIACWCGNCSNFNVPIVTVSVDQIHTRVMGSIFGLGTLWMVEGREESDVEHETRLASFLDYIARVEMKLRRDCDKIFKRSIRHGICWGKLYWVREEQRVRDIQKYKNLEDFKRDFKDAKEAGLDPKEYQSYIQKLNNGATINLTVEYNQVVKNSPKLDMVNAKDIVIPEDTLDYTKARFIYQIRENVTWDELVRGEEEGIYDNLDDLREEVERIETELQAKNKGHVIEDYKKKKYTLIDGLKRIDVNNDEKEELCVTRIVKEYKITLKISLFPYWHQRVNFIPFRIMEGDDINGVSICGRLADMNYAINAMFDQMIDAGTINNTKCFIRRDNVIFSGDSDYWYPGCDLIAKDPNNDIKEMFTSDVKSGSYQNMSLAQRFAEMLVRTSSAMTGRESPSDPNAPAAKTMALLRESNIGVKDYIDNLREPMEEVAYQIVQLTYQCLPEGMEFRVLGKVKEGRPVFEKFNRDEVRMKRADFTLKAANMIDNPETDKFNFLQMYERVRPEPMIDQNPDAVRALLEEMFEKFGQRNIGKYLPSNEEMQQQQIDVQKQAIQQMMGEGGGEQRGGGRPNPLEGKNPTPRANNFLIPKGERQAQGL